MVRQKRSVSVFIPLKLDLSSVAWVRITLALFLSIQEDYNTMYLTFPKLTMNCYGGLWIDDNDLIDEFTIALSLSGA